MKEDLTFEEQAALYELSEADLFKILESENLEEVLSIKPLFKGIAKKKTLRFKPKNNKAGEAFVDTLNPLSYGFLVVDTVFTLLAEITLITFFTAGAIFLAVLGIAGALYFANKYKELQKKEEKNEKRLELLALQKACAEVYLEKHQKLEPKGVVPLETGEAKAEKPKDKYHWWQSKEAIGVSILVGASFFYTYYAITLSFTIAFAGTLLVGTMTGPIGIGIALLASCLIGAYFGYQKYQMEKTNKAVKDEFKAQQKEYNEYYDKCFEIKNQQTATHGRKHKNSDNMTQSLPLPPPFYRRKEEYSESDFEKKPRTHTVLFKSSSSENLEVMNKLSNEPKIASVSNGYSNGHTKND